MVACLLLLVAGAMSAGLRDHPIVGESITYLDGTWKASGGGFTIPATVPGDLITDLQNANVIGDPLYEVNFKNSSIWVKNVWNYTTTFTVTDDNTHVLVFDGIKMHAAIYVNNVWVGVATDEYLRYTFPLAGLSPGVANTLMVSFDPTLPVDGRFMACTGGWDWAPYSDTYLQTARTFSKGIWKSVYVVSVVDTAVTHVVPHVYYLGEYPSAPLQDGTHGGFNVQTRVHFWSPASTTATLSVVGAWSTTGTTQQVVLPAGECNITLNISAPASEMKLWWPTGLGTQTLYNVSVTVSTPQGKDLMAARAIGFRLLVVVTGNDTDPAYVQASKDADGTSLQGMFFRVNGAGVYSRGANMIPMDEMEGRYSAEAHARLVQSAVDGNMNTLRVWGGGVFLPDVWYDTCDALGVIVYHDMQFAQEGHSPSVTSTQEAEFRHQIRRLSHHPSIAIWDGCNECTVVLNTSTAIYATFVLTVVAQEDTSRVIWPSCPSNGWLNGVNRLTAHPNGSPLGLRPQLQTARTFEVHGPYQHGGGWPCVNGDDLDIPFTSNIPITVTPGPIGVMYQNTFASEFGSSVMSSFESMSPMLEPSHWGIHGGEPADKCVGMFEKICTGDNPMAQRNYPCDNIIEVYFGKDDFSQVGELPFKKQLYHCMMGQALLIKSRVEEWRGTNMFGTVIWQLNEIWPTGGWGSIEYGTPVTGQVLGGRWKPLQYLLRASVFADVMAACGSGGQCYVRNDLPWAFTGSITVASVALSNGANKTLYQQPLNLAAGPGTVSFFTVHPSGSASDYVIVSDVRTTADLSVSHNVQPMVAPKDLHVAKATVSFTWGQSQGTVYIDVTTNVPALYVTFTTLAAGRFSDNAFFLVGSRTIYFEPWGAFDSAAFGSSLRVEHVASYL